MHQRWRGFRPFYAKHFNYVRPPRRTGDKTGRAKQKEWINKPNLVWDEIWICLTAAQRSLCENIWRDICETALEETVVSCYVGRAKCVRDKRTKSQNQEQVLCVFMCIFVCVFV